MPPRTAEHIANLRASCTGRKMPPLSSEHKAMISERMMGNKLSKGRKLSEEHKAALRSHRHSAETRAKIAESSRGRKHSDETREKLSRINTGRKHSEETIQKMIAAHAKPDVPCINHPERTAKILGLCPACYHRKWYLDNKERNSERRKETSKKWKEENKERVRASRKIRYEQTRDHRREVSRLWREKNKDEIRIRFIAKKYGISREEYEGLRKESGDVCMICGAKDSLVIDHCHHTNMVRGILCGRCNSGIGLLGDSLARIQSAARYLETRKVVR